MKVSFLTRMEIKLKLLNDIKNTISNQYTHVPSMALCRHVHPSNLPMPPYKSDNRSTSAAGASAESRAASARAWMAAKSMADKAAPTEVTAMYARTHAQGDASSGDFAPKGRETCQ